MGIHFESYTHGTYGKMEFKVKGTSYADIMLHLCYFKLNGAVISTELITKVPEDVIYIDSDHAPSGYFGSIFP